MFSFIAWLQESPKHQTTTAQTLDAAEWLIIRLSVLGGTALTMLGGFFRDLVKFVSGFLADLRDLKKDRLRAASLQEDK